MERNYRGYLLITACLASVISILMWIGSWKRYEQEVSKAQRARDEEKQQLLEAQRLSSAVAASSATAEIYKVQSEELTNDISKIKLEVAKAYAKMQSASKNVSNVAPNVVNNPLNDTTLDDICSRYENLVGEPCYRTAK